MATATPSEPLVKKRRPIPPSEHYELVDGRIVAEHYEVVDGVVVKEPPMGARETWLAGRLIRALILFDPGGKLGTMVEEMLFILKQSPRLRRRPDLAFVSHARWPVTRSVPAAAAWDVVPNIAIEIVSPTDRLSRHINKLEEYFAAGVQRVWVVFPDQCKVYVYDSPTSVRILQVGDDLTAEPVLTGFQLPLATLFETEGDGTTATV